MERAIISSPTNTSIPSIADTAVSPEPNPAPTFVATSALEQLTTPSSPGGSCIPGTTKREEGIVVAIVDGDTIDVGLDEQTFRVRYIGIDTPEQNEDLYWQAIAANQELVYGKRVLLVSDVSETDRYSRLLRYVLVDGTFVNYELVRQGYALVSTYPPDVACSEFFTDTQNRARSAQTGLWAPTPILPVTGGDYSGNSNSGGGNDGGSENNNSGGGNCHRSYPNVCIPPPPPDLDCKDIPYRRFQVLPPDPHRFDGDDDGVGCES